MFFFFNVGVKFVNVLIGRWLVKQVSRGIGHIILGRTIRDTKSKLAIFISTKSHFVT